MKSNILKNIVFLAAFISAGFMLYGCGNGESNDSEKTNVETAVPVNVTYVEIKNITSQKTYAGTLEGIHQADIVAKISERITEVNAEVGNYVKQGQTLIKLDNSGPASQYLQTKANYLNAKKDLERMKALFEQGAVSQQTVDQSQTAYNVAEANFEAAKSTVELVSPISGIVTAIGVKPGDWVNPGQQLATIANINRMIVKFSVSENDVSNFKPGSKVFVYSEFRKGDKVEGTVTEINRSASIDSRSFQITARFNNTKGSYFKPGMFVKVDAVLQSSENVPVIPTKAIIFRNNKNMVFVTKDSLAFSREVTTGVSNENYTEITSGLGKGETVVTLGMNNLKDSTTVSVVNRVK